MIPIDFPEIIRYNKADFNKMNYLKSVPAAFQWLTIIPIPFSFSERERRLAMVFFPIVGITLGLFVSSVAICSAKVLPWTMAAATAVIGYVVMTGALHLDGWMDTWDGFAARKDCSNTLHIMKQSAIGSYACLSCGIWLMVFYLGVFYLKPLDHAVIQGISRTSILLLPHFFSYARENGKGRFFCENKSLLIPLIGICFILLFIGLTSWNYIYLLFISLCITFVAGYWAKRKINGITGDTIGFSIECSNLLQIIVLQLKFFPKELT
jgi:adenosylcobinamide-GDP ribazoletransferase